MQYLFPDNLVRDVPVSLDYLSLHRARMFFVLPVSEGLCGSLI